MRIAVVTTSYPAHPAEPSGHFVRAEARVLAGQGHEVHVVVPHHAGRAPGMDGGIRLWSVPHLGLFGWPGAAARLRARPWSLPGVAPFCACSAGVLRSLRPDLVVAHWLVPSAMPVALGGPRVPLEAVAHGADVRLLLAMPAAARAWLLERVAARARVVRFAAHGSLDALCLAVPSGLADLLRSKARVALPPIEVPDVSALAAALRHRHAGRRLVVLVARLVSSKRVELAIDAMQAMPEDVMLYVIGDGPAWQRLRKRDRTGRVIFEGILPRDQTLAYIAAADLLLHTSAAEAAPTVVREARLLGTPVVACDAGDVSRWAAADAALVVTAPAVGAIRRAMRAVLA